MLLGQLTFSSLKKKRNRSAISFKENETGVHLTILLPRSQTVECMYRSLFSFYVPRVTRSYEITTLVDILGTLQGIMKTHGIKI